MYEQNYFIDALDIVLGWNLPDHLLPSALSNQANLLAGFDCDSAYEDESWELSPESFVVVPQ